jgi:hypothetical protein
MMRHTDALRGRHWLAGAPCPISRVCQRVRVRVHVSSNPQQPAVHLRGADVGLVDRPPSHQRFIRAQLPHKHLRWFPVAASTTITQSAVPCAQPSSAALPGAAVAASLTQPTRTGAALP